MFLLMLLVGWLGPKYLFGLITVLVSYGLYRFYSKVAKYPKGPFPIPIMGNMHQVKLYCLHEAFEEWSKIYGDVFTVWVLHQPLVVIMRSDSIRDALIVHGENFVDRTGEFPENMFKTVENGGIIFSSGENWREQRRNAIHILRDFGMGKNIMEEQVLAQTETFLDYVHKLKNKESVDLFEPVQIMVANVINNLLYGASYPMDKAQRLMKYANAINSIFAEMFGNFFVLIVQILPIAKNFPYIGWKAVGQYCAKMENCIEFVKEDVKSALKDYSKEDEPTCFVQAYYQKMDSNPQLDLDNLYNVCSDFFMAGQETTSHTLRWALLYLAGHQNIQEKIRKEIATTVGFSRLPSLRDKTSMPYTSAFLVELQRACNLFPFSLQRRSTDDVTIAGVLIPGGTCVVPQIYSILYDEKLFPDPKAVIPERFINKDGSLNTDLMGKVAPFGLGKRQCAGESLAKAEIFLGVTSFVQKFKIYPADGVIVDYEPLLGTSAAPKPTNYRLEEVDPNEF